MVFKKCPGQDLNRKRMDEVVCNLPCPSCGSDVEFFFDDKVRICPECGNKVAKSDIQLLRDFGCADWCEAAEKCIGTALYAKIKEAKKKKKPTIQKL
jgi:endogenous inhibitor of DNA gyrase (YacG/DUF329 family)